MESIKFNSTSKNSSKGSDIILEEFLYDDLILRETKISRLVFRPEIVRKNQDDFAKVKGFFIFQRRITDDKWEDYKDVDFRKLKNGEFIKLELKSAPTLKFFDYLKFLHKIADQEGIPQGEIEFIRASKEMKSLYNLSSDEFNKILAENNNGAIELIPKILNWFFNKQNPSNTFEKLNNIDIETINQLHTLSGLENLKRIYLSWEEKQDEKEEYWQQQICSNPILLSQIFSYPIILINDKAYVGGKELDNSGGKIVDYLLKNEISDNSIFIEIKKPNTNLLSSYYRNGVYSISNEISGSIVQISNYKDEFQKNFYAMKSKLNSKTNINIESYKPKCIIIAGNYENQLNDFDKKKSFDLFRSSLIDIEIITYDELFAKINVLIKLLSE